MKKAIWAMVKTIVLAAILYVVSSARGIDSAKTIIFCASVLLALHAGAFLSEFIKYLYRRYLDKKKSAGAYKLTFLQFVWPEKLLLVF